MGSHITIDADLHKSKRCSDDMEYLFQSKMLLDCEQAKGPVLASAKAAPQNLRRAIRIAATFKKPEIAKKSRRAYLEQRVLHSTDCLASCTINPSGELSQPLAHLSAPNNPTPRPAFNVNMLLLPIPGSARA